MTAPEIRVDLSSIRVRMRSIAVVRCESAVIDAAALRDALDGLPADTTDVALVGASTTAAEVLGLAAHSGACATAAPVTDALKQVFAGKITATIERSSVYRAVMPLIVPRVALQNRVRAMAGRKVVAGQLLPDELPVVLVEAET